MDFSLIVFLALTDRGIEIIKNMFNVGKYLRIFIMMGKIFGCGLFFDDSVNNSIEKLLLCLMGILNVCALRIYWLCLVWYFLLLHVEIKINIEINAIKWYEHMNIDWNP